MDVTCESKSDINPLDRDDEKSENEEYEVLRVKRERKMVKRLSLSGKKQKNPKGRRENPSSKQGRGVKTRETLGKLPPPKRQKIKIHHERADMEL
jgi:hypothetical protein